MVSCGGEQGGTGGKDYTGAGRTFGGDGCVNYPEYSDSFMSVYVWVLIKAHQIWTP